MMDTATVRWPDSLWAAATPPGPELPVLEGAAQADVIVIGGGFTGLSTALHLREAGVDVAIVEAMEPGWGASGRNNGQVIPTLSRPDPGRHYCQTWCGRRTFRRAVARQRLDACSIWRGAIKSRPSRNRPAGYSRCIRPAASGSPSAGCGNGRNSARRSSCCPATRPRRMLGSDAWFGGFWNRSGGHINPLALSRGLARVVLERGGRIYARSPATGFERRERPLGGQDRAGTRSAAAP